MPLSDRDYMRSSPPPARRTREFGGFNLNPVLVIIGISFLIFIVTIVWGKGVLDAGGFRYAIYKAHYYLGLIPAIFSEKPWTIITNMFVHANFGHIFGNMLTLYFFGSFFARLVGNGRFLLVYFIGGIVGNILYLLLNMSSFIPVVGASGAIYAIAGALVVMMPNLQVRLYFIIPMPLWVVVLVFFVLWSFIPGVAWQAHMGGLAVGLVAGYFFRRKMRYIIYR